MKSTRTFIPGKGMVDVGPTTPQQANEFDPNGYWSPASQRPNPTDLQYTMDGASSGTGGAAGATPGVTGKSNLAFSADTFVPGGGKQAAAVTAPTYDALGMGPELQGMNQGAVEFVPGGVGDAGAQGSSGVSADPLVEVQYGKRTLIVPESLTEEDPNTGEPFFVAAQQASENGLEWVLSDTTILSPAKRTMHTIGMPENLRQHFASLDLESSRRMANDDPRYKELPQRYGKAFSLDDVLAARGTGGSFGYPSTLYRCLDQFDGNSYAVRRFENVRCNQAVLKNAMDRWAVCRHPAIVSLHSVSSERGALFFTHAYHAGAATLSQRFLDQRGPLLAQGLLWRMACQLLSGMRFAHSRGTALRMVAPIHIILTSGTRFRFNSVGVMEVLEFETRKTAQELLTEDLVRLGLCLLSVASRVRVAQLNSAAHREATSIVKTHCSPDFVNLLTSLLQAGGGGGAGRAKTCDEICADISAHLLDELDLQMAVNDGLHSHLHSEYENGRILKLLIKLGFINERPDYEHAPKWGETGDRYVLRLFRDYVFHQCSGDGAPVLDAGHVIAALNKLDGAAEERVALSSRRSSDLLVVSFADVQRCLEGSFTELCRQSERAMPNEYAEMQNNARTMTTAAAPGQSQNPHQQQNHHHHHQQQGQGQGRPERQRDNRERPRFERPRDNSHRYNRGRAAQGYPQLQGQGQPGLGNPNPNNYPPGHPYGPPTLHGDGGAGAGGGHVGAGNARNNNNNNNSSNSSNNNNNNNNNNNAMNMNMNANASMGGFQPPALQRSNSAPNPAYFTPGIGHHDVGGMSGMLPPALAGIDLGAAFAPQVSNPNPNHPPAQGQPGFRPRY